MDAHLTWPHVTSGSLAASLAELGSIDRAIGALIGQGFPPEEARRELGRRAGATGARVTSVSRELVASLRRDSGRRRPDRSEDDPVDR